MTISPALRSHHLALTEEHDFFMVQKITDK